MTEKLSNSIQQKLPEYLLCAGLQFSRSRTSSEHCYMQGLLSRSFTSCYLTKDHHLQIQKDFPSLTFVLILPFHFFTSHSSLGTKTPCGSVKDLGLWDVTNLDHNTSSAACMVFELEQLA